MRVRRSPSKRGTPQALSPNATDIVSGQSINLD
jgi:hypothetical protein